MLLSFEVIGKLFFGEATLQTDCERGLLTRFCAAESTPIPSIDIDELAKAFHKKIALKGQTSLRCGDFAEKTDHCASI